MDAVTRFGTHGAAAAHGEYADLVDSWGITPHLQTLLADDLAGR